MYHLLLRNSIIGLILITSALGLGILGYHFFEGLSWLDSFLNAAMILSGMGQVTILTTVDGKLFAGFYVLFSGFEFISIVIIMMSPIIHVSFRKIHLETTRNKMD